LNNRRKTLGQKIHPVLYRIGVNKDTDSIWFEEGFVCGLSQEEISFGIISKNALAIRWFQKFK
jgi:hypothetical protein